MKPKHNIIILIVVAMLLSSCISRLGRPSLSGVITDFDGKPLENCSVGEVVTDKNGKFTLSEKRYNQFLLTELFKMEAPPLMVSELINKKGYEAKEVYAFSTFGGGGPKGSKWELDTIRLKKEKQNIKNLMFSTWHLSTNEKMDTIYFIKSNFHDISKTRNARNFYYEYEKYTNNYLDSSGKTYLPKDVLRRDMTISFNANKTFNAEKIIQYENKDGDWRDVKPNDTIQIQGQWNFDDTKIHLNSDVNELNGLFKIIKFDYEYMQWCKPMAD